MSNQTSNHRYHFIDSTFSESASLGLFATGTTITIIASTAVALCPSLIPSISQTWLWHRVRGILTFTHRALINGVLVTLIYIFTLTLHVLLVSMAGRCAGPEIIIKWTQLLISFMVRSLVRDNRIIDIILEIHER